jgi:hypothetical protein
VNVPRLFEGETKQLSAEPAKSFVFVDFSSAENAANPESAYASLLGTPAYIRFLSDLDAAAFLEHVEGWSQHAGLSNVAGQRVRSTTMGQMGVINRLFPQSNRVNLSLIENLTRLYWAYMGRLSMRVHDFASLDASSADSVATTRIVAVMSAVLHTASARRSLYLASLSTAPSFSLDVAPLHDLTVLPAESDRDPYYRHLMRILLYCQTSGYVHKGDQVYRRKCVNVPDIRRDSTSSTARSVTLPFYEPFAKIADFMVNFQPMLGSDPSAEPVDLLTVPNNVHGFAKYASRLVSTAKHAEIYNTAHFPLLSPRRELYCFLDGVYNVDTDAFVSLDDLGPRSFCINYIDEFCPRAARTPAGLGLGPDGKPKPPTPLEHTFFAWDADPRDFDEDGLEECRERTRARLRETNPGLDDPALDALERELDPMNIPTPEVDFLLDFQWFDAGTPRDELPPNLPRTCVVRDKEVVRRFFYAMIGRMFHPLGQMEKWQVFNLLIGYANTGKSLISELIQATIGHDNVGVLSSTTERGWELSSGMDEKLAVVCPELGKTHNLPITDLLSMACGEKVRVTNKNDPQRMVAWKSHMWFQGNRMCDWEDSKNNLARRQVAWIWDRIVALHRRDETLLDQILANRGALLVKANRMYLALVRHLKRHNINSFFKVLPAYNLECARRVRQQVDPLRAFADSGVVVFGKGMLCPIDVLRRAFERYCRDHCVKAPGGGATWLEALFHDHSLGYHSDVVSPVVEPVEPVAGGRKGGLDRWVTRPGARQTVDRVTMAEWPDYFTRSVPRVKGVFITGVDLHPREWDDELASRYGVSKATMGSISLDNVRPEFHVHFEACRTDASEAIAAARPGPSGAERACLIGRVNRCAE